MIISHKIRLYPNKEQKILLKKSCGVARFAYNWGLATREEKYKNGEKITVFDLKKLFNSVKKTEFPFVCEVTKCAAEGALLNLGVAYNNFFKKKSKHPTFKKKGVHDSFGISNDQFSFKDDNHVKLPRIGLVHTAEKLRFSGKIMNGVVSHQADKWFLSVGVEVESHQYKKTGKLVGIDLGVKDLVITSDGKKFVNLKALKKSEKKLKKLNRIVSRRKKLSKRREKAKVRLAWQHLRVANQRKDYIHKITTYLVRQYDVICMEDLNTKGMLKNHKLAKSISDTSFGEIRRQLEYKCVMRGKQLLFVDRWFPSSKTCSRCGSVQENMPLNIREWTCPDCGIHHDRDLNAAVNIVRQAMSEFTRGEKSALAIEPISAIEVGSIVKLDSLNRESYILI